MKCFQRKFREFCIKEKSRNFCLFETSPNSGEGDNHDHLIILLKKLKNFDAIIHPHTRFLRFFLHISELFVFCWEPDSSFWFQNTRGKENWVSISDLSSKSLSIIFLVHPVLHNSFPMSREGVHPGNILAYLSPLRGDCRCLLLWNNLNLWLFVDKYIFPDTFYVGVIIIVGTLSVDTISVHCTVWCI